MRFIPAVSLVRIRLPLPFRPVGQAVKTPPFHGGNMGSIPVRVTTRQGVRRWPLVLLYHRLYFGDIAQLVRAFASHARGHGFEPPCLHQRSRMRKHSGFFCFFTLRFPAGKTASNGKTADFRVCRCLYPYPKENRAQDRTEEPANELSSPEGKNIHFCPGYAGCTGSPTAAGRRQGSGARRGKRGNERPKCIEKMNIPKYPVH